MVATNGNYQPMVQLGQMYLILHRIQTTTNTLTITSVTNGMNGFKYRVQLNKIGNSCGLNSNETTLTVYPLPVVNDVTIIQCDDDLNITSFNLTVKNNVISSNSANETFPITNL
jgi:hypothetical protein